MQVVTPILQRAVRLAPEPETALWFDVGRMDPIDAKRLPIDVLMHLPFKRTGVAGVDSKGREFVLWMLAEEKSVTVAGCALDGQVQYFEPFAYIQTDEGLRYYNAGREVSRDAILPAFRMVFAVLDKLSGGGTGYQPKPQDTFINRKRKAKGKPAISFDWHTVEIGPKAVKNAPQGGTHASPRLHDRRGHWRTCRTGRKAWVKPCKVGDASRGVVFKDYRVAETLQ